MWRHYRSLGESKYETQLKVLHRKKYIFVNTYFSNENFLFSDKILMNSLYSVGIEEADDLIKDLTQALEKACGK